MGAEVELEELELGAPGPDVTPPQGVILTHLESDGWTRKYLYKASYDALGSRKQSKILMSEVRPEPGMDGAYEPAAPQEERQVHFQRQGGLQTIGNPFSVQMGGASRPISPVADNRLNLPPGSSVPFVGHGPLLGQMQTPPTPAPAPVGPPSDGALPLANATPPAPPAEPVGPDCTRSLQLPDGTVINPEDSITLKDFCAMIPWLESLLQKNAPSSSPNGPIRPGGRIPLSVGVPSFGPAGGPFAQGGFGGGGGGGGVPGAGPIGVVTGPTPIGGPGQATQGPPGPAGPPGPGNVIDGAQKTDGNFGSTGAMVPIPGLTIPVTVGADGKLAVSFSFILQAAFPGDIIYDVFAGIQIDATQYQLWENSEQQGAGADKVFIVTATGILFASGLTPGPHTVSVIYGDNPALNHFTVVTSPSQPACVVAQHS